MKKGAKRIWRHVFITGILCISILFTSNFSPYIQAEAGSIMTDIRIGLKGLYSGVSSIKIKTTAIGLGYSINDRYICDTEFKSSSGFTFTPATGCYYIMTKTFSTYQSAKTVANALKELNVSAYPVSVYRNYWKVYIGGVLESQMPAVYEKIKGRFGYSYSGIEKDNGHRVLVEGTSDSFLIDAEKKNAYPQFKALISNQDGVAVMDLGTRKYRGRIEIGRYNKSTLTAVNIINVESYLYGVITSEMPSSWPMEALKVQAVCARSFALAKTEYSADSNAEKACSIDDTTSSQSYKGYEAETASGRRAVNATKGEVVQYKGKTISAFFFSTSGGSTEDGVDVWGGNLPYLKAVPDLYETSPEMLPWIKTYTKAEIAGRLSSYKLGVGNITRIYPAITTSTGRVYSLRVMGSSSKASLQTGTIRDVLNLYSTKFKVISYGDIPDKVSVRSEKQSSETRISNSYILSADGTAKAPKLEQYIVMGQDNLSNYAANAPKDENTYYFAGMGYGHGVGMSQSGAKGMAQAGFTYKQIVEYYYTGCKIGIAS